MDETVSSTLFTPSSSRHPAESLKDRHLAQIASIIEKQFPAIRTAIDMYTIGFVSTCAEGTLVV